MASTFSTASFRPAEPSLWPLADRGYWLGIPLVAVAYASVAAISLVLAIPPGYASAIWPPAGIALFAWLAFGWRIWPGILLGAAIANIGVTGTPVLVALSIGAGNTAEAMLAGFLIQRLVNLKHRFEQPSAVWKFAAIAFIAPLIAATNGVATLALAGQVPWAEFGIHWLTWWLGDATGIIIVAPLLLCWSEPSYGKADGETWIEYQLFAALLVLFGMLAWAVRLPSDAGQTLAYLMIPLVTWAAARLDQRAVTGASFAISAVAVIDMLDGTASMFSPWSVNASLLLLQLFVSAVALTGLTLSSLAGNVLRMNAILERSRAALQRAVRKGSTDLDRTLAMQMQLAKRMVGIRDEERRRVAADLHDGVAQDLTSLGVSLDLMRVERSRRNAKWLEERVDEAGAIVKRAGTSLRAVIGGLRPLPMNGHALGSALKRHAAEFEARTGILVSVLAVPHRDTVPLAVKDAFFRIFMEALANIARHADASMVRVTLEAEPGRERLVVEDNGRGFSVQGPDGRDAQAGSGLPIMKERAIAIGATFDVRSTPGGGTRIECRLCELGWQPVPSGSAEEPS